MGERVGYGIFGWEGNERRSNRYGAFLIGETPYDANERVAAHLDLEALRALVGKRVHIRCVVTKARDSGHAGDMFLKLKPSTPNAGEIVDLGVGVLRLEDPGFGWLPAVTLVPEDNRESLWFDPRKLYRLHDQTVDVFVEETSEPFSPAPDIKLDSGTEPEAIDLPGGYTQVKNTRPDVNYRIPAHLEKIGDGLFRIDLPRHETGKRRKLERA
jgi:hypothetical protein